MSIEYVGALKNEEPRKEFFSFREIMNAINLEIRREARQKKKGSARAIRILQKLKSILINGPPIARTERYPNVKPPEVPADFMGEFGQPDPPGIGGDCCMPEG